MPLPQDTFYGRDSELAELGDLIARCRLVTVVGSGGTGKTRLSLELARRRDSGTQPAGSPAPVWTFVDLAEVSDADALGQALVAALGIEAPSADEVSRRRSRRLRPPGPPRPLRPCSGPAPCAARCNR